MKPVTMVSGWDVPGAGAVRSKARSLEALKVIMISDCLCVQLTV